MLHEERREREERTFIMQSKLGSLGLWWGYVERERDRNSFFLISRQLPGLLGFLFCVFSLHLLENKGSSVSEQRTEKVVSRWHITTRIKETPSARSLNSRGRVLLRKKNKASNDELKRTHRGEN